MSTNSNQIFLLEILVQNVKIDKFCLENSINAYLEVRFGGLPCFALYPERSNVREGQGSNNLQDILPFNCGKTCLFVNTSEELAAMIREQPIGVGLVRIAEVATEPVMIAQSEIMLSREMLEMVQETITEPSAEPVNEHLETISELLDASLDPVGELEAFVRLTCLGRSVVTQIKMSEDDKYQFETMPVYADNACKGCEAGRPGPADIPNLMEKCDSSVSLTNAVYQAPAKGNPSSASVGAADGNKKGSCCRPQANTQTKETNSKEENRKPMKKPAKPDKPEKKKNKEIPVDNFETVGPQAPPPEIKVGRVLSMHPIEEVQYSQEDLNRKKKGKSFPLEVSYPGIMIGHTYCQYENPLVPARQGWAWKTTVLEGVMPPDRTGWKPGYYRKCYLNSLRRKPKIHMIKRLEKPKKTDPSPTAAAKPTLNIIRKHGEYQLTINAPGAKEPRKYSYPANLSDSDLELNLNLPDRLPTPPPKLKHQAQQFCEEDFIVHKPESKAKKLKKGKKGKKEGKKAGKKPPKKKAGEDLTAVAKLVKPWDTWVMKLKCVTKKEKKKKGKDGKKKSKK